MYDVGAERREMVPYLFEYEGLVFAARLTLKKNLREEHLYYRNPPTVVQ